MRWDGQGSGKRPTNGTGWTLGPRFILADPQSAGKQRLELELAQGRKEGKKGTRKTLQGTAATHVPVPTLSAAVSAPVWLSGTSPVHAQA